MYTKFKFSPADISQAAVAAAANLAKAMPGTNAPTWAAKVIADRLAASPADYLQFGPYWWAVKDALAQLGRDFGVERDELVRMEYGGGLPAYAALVSGENFREFYMATYLAGSSTFVLDDEEGQSYTLFDRDMEARRLGQVVLADGGAEEEGGSMLDSAASEVSSRATMQPFSVKAAIGTELWSVEVFADDKAAAELRVKELEASGRIGRALDVAKGARGPMAFDNTDYDQALFVDLVSRRICEL